MLQKNSPRSVARLLVLSLAVLGVGACVEGPLTNDGSPNLSPDGTSCPVAADIGFATLSDEESAQVFIAVNLREIQHGQLALQQATNSKVREFAERLVRDHTAANQKLQTHLQGLGITPRESPLSQQLMAESNQLLTMLRSNVGAETFDLAFIDAQISQHAKTLFLRHKVIQPQIQRAELYDFALAAREVVKNHLNTAVLLQQELAPSP